MGLNLRVNDASGKVPPLHVTRNEDSAAANGKDLCRPTSDPLRADRSQCSRFLLMALHPEVVWAQRSDKVFLSIELPDAKEVTQSLEPEGKLLFSAKAGPENKAYEANLELFDKIDTEASKFVAGMRHVSFLLVKAEKQWWPRLLKAPGKAPAFIKVDWDKWVDEDEETTAGGMDMDFMKQFQGAGGFGGMGGMGGMDMASMANMGGMGGMDMASMGMGMGDEEEEEEDEELPELEK